MRNMTGICLALAEAWQPRLFIPAFLLQKFLTPPLSR
jgi:hypothetical protein